jgi:hypothetical protein
VYVLADPGGIIPAKAVNRLKKNYLGSISMHIEHYREKEALGVPLLKSLVKKRIEGSEAKDLLGVFAGASAKTVRLVGDSGSDKRQPPHPHP